MTRRCAWYHHRNNQHRHLSMYHSIGVRIRYWCDWYALKNSVSIYISRRLWQYQRQNIWIALLSVNYARCWPGRWLHPVPPQTPHFFAQHTAPPLMPCWYAHSAAMTRWALVRKTETKQNHNTHNAQSKPQTTQKSNTTTEAYICFAYLEHTNTHRQALLRPMQAVVERVKSYQDV